MVSAVRFAVSVGGLAALEAVFALVPGLAASPLATRLALLGLVLLVAASMSAALIGRTGRALVALVVMSAAGIALLVAAVVLGAPAATLGACGLILVWTGARTRGLIRRLGAHEADPDAWVEDARWAIERSYRNAAIGAGLASTAFAITLAGAHGALDVGPAPLLLLAGSLIGVSLGIACGSPMLASTTEQLLGPNLQDRRRIAAAVLARRPGALHDGEVPLAARYARIAGRLVVLRVVQSASTVAALVLLSTMNLAEHTGRHLDVLAIISAVVVLAAVVVTVGSIPSTVASVRRARVFAAAHGGTVV